MVKAFVVSGWVNHVSQGCYLVQYKPSLLKLHANTLKITVHPRKDAIPYEPS